MDLLKTCDFFWVSH